MKVVRVDNYNREIYEDKLIKDKLTVEEAEKLAAKLNRDNDNDEYWYIAAEDSYELFERDF